MNSFWHFAEAKENLDNLVKAIDTILDQILDNRKSLPGSFRRICHHIKAECSRKLAEVGVESDTMSESFFPPPPFLKMN